jgi:hypothetical protein
MEKQTTQISPSISGILNQRVSYQQNAWSSLCKELTIHEALDEIKSDTHKQQVTNLRNLLKSGNKEGYNNHKKNLPAVTFCGTFDGERKKIKLQSYNSVIVLDVDKLGKEEFQQVINCFIKDKFVFALWESPSQEGIKGLVYLQFTFELNETNIDRAHKVAFQKLSVYFKESYNIELDNSGSDTTRLCFFSFDPFLTLKDEIIGFNVDEDANLQIVRTQEKNKSVELVHASNRDALYNPKERNNPGDRFTMQAIIRFLEKRKLSITYSYDEWYKVASAIANTFTFDIGEKYFLKLSSIDKGKYNESNCKNFLLNCYEKRTGAVKFRSIVYFANEKGYVTKKQRERGSEVADESLSHVSSSNTVIHLPEDLKK